MSSEKPATPAASASKPKRRPRSRKKNGKTPESGQKTSGKASGKPQGKPQGKGGAPPPQEKAPGKAKSAGRRRERYRKKNESSQGFKLVLRHLPPNLSAEAFHEQLTAATGNTTSSAVDHYFMPGSLPSNIFDKPTYARAYFTFATMEQLREFAGKVRTVQFTDDLNNVTSAVLRLSPYVKRLSPSTQGGRTGRGKKLEGSVEKDAVFKQFLRSMAKLREDRDAGYVASSVSILRSLDRQLAKEREQQVAIDRNNEQALIQLAGSETTKKKKKKKKKKEKKKTAEQVEEARARRERKKKAKREKRERKRAQATAGAQGAASNVVILEEAGRRELRKRQQQLERKEQEAKAQEKRLAKAARAKEKKLLKRQEQTTGDATPGQKPHVKVLKRQDI